MKSRIGSEYIPFNTLTAILDLYRYQRNHLIHAYLVIKPSLLHSVPKVNLIGSTASANYDDAAIFFL